MKLFFGLVFSGAISYFAFSRNSLSRGGMLAAIGVGTVVYTWGSPYWYGLLLAFFISSSLLSHFQKANKGEVENLFDKTGKRDAVQVLANGGIGALLVLLSFFSHDTMPFMIFYLGVIATVNADTWGTELGVLSGQSPRHVLTWKRMERGGSGGISTLGTVSSFVGGLFIGGCAAVFLYFESGVWESYWILIGAASGLFGSLLDSVLGASVQRMYVCSVCNRETEKSLHCSSPTLPIRGYTWCSNDFINALSSLGGGAVAWILWKVMIQ